MALLQAGADPNLQDKRGRTPLHLATQYSRKMIPILLKHGASVAIADNAGLTPLDLAREKGIPDSIMLRTTDESNDQAP